MEKALPSLVRQRREVLPNPGAIEIQAQGGNGKNLDLLPGAEKRSKNVINENISSSCKITTVPACNSEISGKLPIEAVISEAVAG